MTEVAHIAIVEIDDAVVWAAEGDEILDGRFVARFHPSPHELSTLREADGVDCGGGAKDGVFSYQGAGGGYVFSEVAKEGGVPVTPTVRGEADVIAVGGANGVVEEGTNGLHPIRIVAKGKINFRWNFWGIGIPVT